MKHQLQGLLRVPVASSQFRAALEMKFGMQICKAFTLPKTPSIYGISQLVYLSQYRLL